MTTDKQGRVYAKLSELKAGDWIEPDDGFCVEGKVQVQDGPTGLYFTCKEGKHYLDSQLDNQGYLVGVYPVATNLTPVIALENTDMVREWATKFANMMVEASDMAKIVHALREELEAFKAQIVVANEAAARAIAERDDAFKAKARAEEIQAQAEHAYQSVNEARINAERETSEVKAQLIQFTNANAKFATKLDDAIVEVELLKEEIARLIKANEYLKSEHESKLFYLAENHNAQVTSIHRANDLAIADVRERAEAKIAQVEAEKSAANLVAQSLRDERKHIQDELAVTANDLTILRKIIAEAKLAADGIRGVLEGTMAAE